MPSLLTPLGQMHSAATTWIAAAWRWWRSEMEDLYEEVLGPRFGASQSKARLSIESQSILLQLRTGRQWATVSQLPRPSEYAGLPHALSGLIRKAPPSVRAIQIQWPAERVLRRWMTLPSAVKPRLRTAVAYQLDRLSPFKSSDIYFDCTAVSAPARTDRLQVCLAIVPRREVDTLIGAIDPQGALDVTVMAPPSDGAPALTFLSRRGRRERNIRKRLDLVLAGSLAILLLFTLGTIVWKRMAEQRLIDSRLAALREKAKEAEAVHAALDVRMHQISALEQQLLAQDTAQILSELTQEIPDGSWIYQFQQEGTSLVLSGFARNASELVSILKRNPAFSNAELRSAMQQPGSSNERYEIAIKLKAFKDGPVR